MKAIVETIYSRAQVNVLIKNKKEFIFQKVER